MKKAYIVHGWGANSNSDWFPWLKKELESRDYQVFVLDMPNTDEPEIESWVERLEKVITELDEDTILIGHSIGCQTIMRYLARQENEKVGKIIFVAPWFNLINMDDDEIEIAKPWIETVFDFDKIKSATNNIIALFSDNDPVVPIDDAALFESRLNAQINIFENKGHFNGEDGCFELPEILELID